MVKSTRIKAYAAVAAIFVLGAGAGAAASYAYAQRQLASIFDEEDGPAFEEHHRLRALERELGLSAEQREQIHALHRRHGERRRKLMHDMVERCGADMETDMASRDAEIRGLLNDEQKARFDQLVAKRRDHFRLGPRHGAHGEHRPAN
ncbi:MAG TPA: hypothetical protein VGP93_12080 [Polyangiaceae bacterium]|nr:hypothetical protein [Polyangiaceae bacterium]